MAAAAQGAATVVLPSPMAPLGTEGAPRGPADLDALEQELTQQVPQLLETMNRSSTEVNTYDLQLAQAQGHHRKLLSQWSRLYEDLRESHGGAIDRVRPYFDATQALAETERRVQAVAREFSGASSLHAQAKQELCKLEAEMEMACAGSKVSLDMDQQDAFSRATVRVLKCQQERDHREVEYANALREFQEAQETTEAWRAQLGDLAIKRALPSFRQLQQHQETLAGEQCRIKALTERVRHSKAAYHNSMRALDRISNAVHEARREHKQAEEAGANGPQQATDAEAKVDTQVPPTAPALPPNACAPGRPKLPPEEAPEAITPMASATLLAEGVGGEQEEKEELDQEERLSQDCPAMVRGAGFVAEVSSSKADDRLGIEAPPEVSPEGGCRRSLETSS